MENTFTCPKCQATNVKGAVDCEVCGIIFAKYSAKQSNVQQISQQASQQMPRQVSQQMSQQVPQQVSQQVPQQQEKINNPAKSKKIPNPVSKLSDANLQQLWEQVMSNYDNMDMHEDFINQAMQSNNLAFASQQYRNILSSHPNEDIAQKMQSRITQMAMNLFTPEHIPEVRRFHFGISGTIITLGIMLMGMAYLFSELFVKMSFNPKPIEITGSVMVIAGFMMRFAKRKTR